MIGKIHVFCGPMFSGKSTSMLGLLDKYCHAGKKVAYYTSTVDTRTGDFIRLKSARQEEYRLPVKKLGAELDEEITAEAVALDEVQFFDDNIVEFCQNLRQKGVVVLVSGLDMDYRQRPFGSMGQLMAIANTVTKLTAVCECGADAIYTKRVTAADDLIVIGDGNYVPCCEECYKMLK